MLKNEHLVAKIGVDTAENEPEIRIQNINDIRIPYVRSPGTLVAGAEARPPGLGGLLHGLVGLGDHGRPGEVVRGGPGLTGSIGEGPNHSNY